MSAPPLVITEELVLLDATLGVTSREVITHLAQVVTAAGRATQAEQLADAAFHREEQSPTGVIGKVAIPHCRSAAVVTASVVFARLSQPVDFGGPDGPADLIFFIAVPEGAGKKHLSILSKLARSLARPDFLTALRRVDSTAALLTTVNEALQLPSQSTAAPATPAGDKRIRIIAVTACPTGIAHTYLAADALAEAVQSRPNVSFAVEPQGSSTITPLPPATIEAADVVIFATDIRVRDRDRFAAKPMIESSTERAINEPDALIEEAIAAVNHSPAHQVNDTTAALAQNPSFPTTWAKRCHQAVMTGVSYMVPFVAAGGLLLALGFLIGGYDIVEGWQTIVTSFSLTHLPDQEINVNGELMTFDRSGLALYFGSVLFATGQAAMQFIVAALSGYISYALAGRPGIAPGFIGGAIAIILGAGFIGGLVTGLVAGGVAMCLGALHLPQWLSALMPVVIIPLLASLVVGVLMYLVLGRPLATIMTGLQDWLGSLSGTSAILLGIILGLMMCFDLGGPVNKAAYLFATAGLSTGDDSSLRIMAAVMSAGMVPPIAMSVATFLRSSLFTPTERENGKSSWLLGLSFVSEGAIPFAAADPFRVIPSLMLGGAITGAISMAWQVESRAPHGGIFVLFAISPWWGWLLALLAGTAVAATAVVTLKHFWPHRTAQHTNL